LIECPSANLFLQQGAVIDAPFNGINYWNSARVIEEITILNKLPPISHFLIRKVETVFSFIVFYVINLGEVFKTDLFEAKSFLLQENAL
jgi:hypothetical protein